MIKKIVSFICVMLIVICPIFSGCAHTHIPTAATCTEPKKCEKCGEVIGVALGHDWIEATCTRPKRCTRCGLTEGEALGHDWIEATCVKAKTCARCDFIEGERLGHDWIEATCTEPKTCSRCSLSEGSPLGHDAYGLSCTEGAHCSRCGEDIPALGHEWVDATCTDPRTCSRCGVVEGSALGHSPADNPEKKTIKKATCTEDGSYEEVVYCTLCHEELSKESFTEPALGHTTTSGKCTRCGLEVYETIYGSGDDVISNITVGDGIYRVHFTNNGSRNIVVWVYDTKDNKDLAVNEIGYFDGYTLLLGAGPFTFEIESSGSWSYTIEAIGNTTEKSFEGNGYYVTSKFSAKTGTWHFTHDGKSNFVVWLYTTDGRDLIVNEIGFYDGKRRLNIPTGSSAILVIEADGNWSASPEN